jgi:NAD(P)-dependent dehydrogenase (short-subunit alcohol dehydrogenase family)
MKIAILGGTGREGTALALRWAASGEDVIIGSREEKRAVAVAEHLNRRWEDHHPWRVEQAGGRRGRGCGADGSRSRSPRDTEGGERSIAG